MMLDDYVQRLAKELELASPIRKETQGVYVLSIDEGLEITISDLAPGFSFHCAIAPCPKVNEETFLTQAMLANLFGQGTEGAVLGLDEEGNILTLSIENAQEIDYKIFQETLEDFLNAVDYWRDEVAETSEPTK